MKFNGKLAVAAAVLAFGGLMQGCSTTSSHPDADGQSSQIVFPKAEQAWPKGGTIPRLDYLSQVKSGVTKDQLFELLGRPHFNEFSGREWDYLFKFHKGNKGELLTCQYKILFDGHKLARSFHWKPENCADLLKAKAATPAVQVAPVPATPVPVPMSNVSLQADTLFAFNGWRLEALNPKGRAQLAALASELRSMTSLSRVEVAAYTDRIGSPAANLALSQRRAETIRSFLALQGVNPQLIAAQGRGAADPVVLCGNRARVALIQCLAPNRRVEVSVTGQKRS